MPIGYPTQIDLSSVDRLERVFRNLCDKLNDLERADLDTLKTAVRETERIRQRTEPPVIQRLIQASGPAPLNVEGLLGILAQPQKAGVPTVDALPDVLLAQDGELASFQNIIYRFDGTTEPGTWRAIRATAVITQGLYSARPSVTTADNGLQYFATDQDVTYIVEAGAWIYHSGFMTGTLSPDQKPTLAAGDADFLFYSTDFDHFYRWAGAAWKRVSGEAPGSIIFSAVSLSGITGYQLCDGTATTRSTDAGGTAAITVPDYSTAAYIKAANALAIGPTAAGGATTSVVATNQATVVTAHTVVERLDDAGTGVFVFDTAADADHATHNHTQDAHSHGPNTLELRRSELLAYCRL